MRKGHLTREWKFKRPRTWLDVLKRELVKTIVLLDCEVYFNIVLFNREVRIWTMGLEQAVWENKVKALEFFLNAGVELQTRTGEAVFEAFRFVEKGMYHGTKMRFSYEKSEHPFFPL